MIGHGDVELDGTVTIGMRVYERLLAVGLHLPARDRYARRHAWIPAAGTGRLICWPASMLASSWTVRAGDANAARRLLSIALVLEGTSRTDAARAAGMDRQTLRDWVHRYNAGGPEALSNRRAPGRAPSLTPEQTEQVAAWVQTGPDLEADGVVRWRRKDPAARIQPEFGVTLAERSVGALLRRLGLRPLSVRPRHPKQDPEAVEAHKKLRRAGPGRDPGAPPRSSAP